MSSDRAARIEKIITGVLRQVFSDAGSHGFVVPGHGPDAQYVATLCKQAGGSGGGGLVIHPASKTLVLLGAAPAADVLPLGDLYASQVVALAGAAELPPEVQELAAACGGAETLDQVLRRHFDERRSWEAAAEPLSSPAATLLKKRIDAARFRRTHIGLVPKLGARTPGIDLYA